MANRFFHISQVGQHQPHVEVPVIIVRIHCQCLLEIGAGPFQITAHVECLPQVKRQPVVPGIPLQGTLQHVNAVIHLPAVDHLFRIQDQPFKVLPVTAPVHHQDVFLVSQEPFPFLPGLDVREDPVFPHVGEFFLLDQSLFGQQVHERSQTVTDNNGVLFQVGNPGPQFLEFLKHAGEVVFKLGEHLRNHIILVKFFHGAETGICIGNQPCGAIDADRCIFRVEKPAGVAIHGSSRLTVGSAVSYCSRKNPGRTFDPGNRHPPSSPAAGTADTWDP